MEKVTRIGLYKNEVYIEHAKGATDVIRPVERSVLHELKTIQGLKDYGFDDIWKSAVNGDETTLGLDDFLQELLDDYPEPEDFPNKDDSWTDILTDEEYEEVENYLLENYGIDAGTWEAAGCYSPEGEYELIIR